MGTTSADILQEFLTADPLKVVLPTVLLGIFGLLAFLGKELIVKSSSAKRTDDLLERFTKEISVRDALLKLKLLASASESDSSQQASVKNLRYKQAEELEADLEEGLKQIRASEDWWKRASPKEKFIPSLYDGRKHLDGDAKFGWWLCMFNYVLMLLSLIYVIWYIYLCIVSNAFYGFLVFAIFGLFFFWLAIRLRRAAYDAVELSRTSHPVRD